MAADFNLTWVLDHVYAWFRWLWEKVILPNRSAVLLLLVLASLIISLARYVLPTTHRRVVLYTGTSTADASTIGQHIKSHFRSHGTGGFITYEFDLQPSEGLRDNRDRVAAAAERGELVLGFGQDGFDPPEQVRTLLPLAEMYLHVVANRAAVDELAAPADVKRPTFRKADAGPDTPPQTDLPKPATFGGLVTRLKKTNTRPVPRCFLRPKLSGGRQIAEKVLQFYGIDVAEADTEPNIEWEAAYRKLAAGDLDVIFDASDLGSESIARQGKTKAVALIGLDDVAGLTAGQNSLKPQRIPKNAYVYGNGFCRADLDTVCTRRLIICPRSISNTTPTT
jgi:TRAP-type uncharacterized transport system substrate-binding protein